MLRVDVAPIDNHGDRWQRETVSLYDLARVSFWLHINKLEIDFLQGHQGNTSVFSHILAVSQVAGNLPKNVATMFYEA